MSTRSAIGYMMPSGRIKAVYCHWDGHPDTKERELKKYKDKKSVVALIKKGSMSSLETRSTWLSGEHGYFAEAREPQPLYHSERGDKWATCKPRVSISKREAMRFWSGWDCEYLYVFTPDGWKTFPLRGEN
tara:strand:- start:6644 stop:7036 length:393 start_codon:yes stop_codon:yes gene_type:complete